MSWRAPRRSHTIGALEITDDEGVTTQLREGSEDVFALAHCVRFRIREAVDASMTWDALRTPASELGIIRPLVQELTKTQHPALIYALLLNRIHFQHEAEDEIAFQGLYNTRAMVCELVAMRSLSSYASRPLHLVSILTSPFDAMSGAARESFDASDRPNEEQFARLKKFGETERVNALELGILSQAKRFIAAPLVTRTLDAIFDGSIRYQPAASKAILSDSYKALVDCVEIYDPTNRPVLDHYRLRTPMIRAWLELFNFGAMTVLYTACQFLTPDEGFTVLEGVFIIYALGFGLDEIAQAAHGDYYSDNLNYLDAVWLVDFLIYAILRLHGFATHNTTTLQGSLDVLSLGAVILYARLAITLTTTNVVTLGVSAMAPIVLSFFALSTLVASGFVVALYCLADGAVSFRHCAWLLLNCVLSNNFMAINESAKFGPFLGPLLITVFSFLVNFMLLTVLISLLTNAFTAIQSQATEEILFQRAVKTVRIERCKSEALFEFMPPFNLLAFAIAVPASQFLSPRRLHSLYVFLIRATNLPVLLLIYVHRKWQLSRTQGRMRIHEATDRIWEALPRALHVFERGAGGLAERVFDRAVTEEGRAVKGLHPPEVDEAPIKSPARTPRVSRDNGYSVFRASPMGLFGRATRQSGSETLSALHENARSDAAEDYAKVNTIETVNSLEARIAAMEATLSAMHDMLKRLAERPPDSVE